MNMNTDIFFLGKTVYNCLQNIIFTNHIQIKIVQVFVYILFFRCWKSCIITKQFLLLKNLNLTLLVE